MKLTVLICLVVLISWSVIALIQLWMTPFTAAFFVKFTITAAIIEVVTLIAGLAIREYLKEKQLKDQGYID